MFGIENSPIVWTMVGVAFLFLIFNLLSLRKSEDYLLEYDEEDAPDNVRVITNNKEVLVEVIKKVEDSAKFDELKEKLSNTITELDNSKLELSSLTRANEALANNNQELIDQIELCENEINILNLSVSEQQDNISNLEKYKELSDELKGELSQLQETVDSLNNTIDEDKIVHNNLSETNNSLKNENTQLKLNNDQLGNVISNLNLDIDSLQDTIKNLKTQVSNLDLTNEELSERNTILAESIENIKKTKSALSDEMNELSINLDLSKSHNRNLQTSNTKLLKEKEDLVELFNSSQNKIKKLEAKLVQKDAPVREIVNNKKDHYNINTITNVLSPYQSSRVTEAWKTLSNREDQMAYIIFDGDNMVGNKLLPDASFNRFMDLVKSRIVTSNGYKIIIIHDVEIIVKNISDII